MEEIKEGKGLCNGRELDMPHTMWFSSKISVDGRHLRALQSLKMRPNAKRKQASQTPHKLCKVTFLFKFNIENTLGRPPIYR